MFYWEYLLFMLPAMIIAVWAQISVSSTFKKYSALPNINGMTGAQAARIIIAITSLLKNSVNSFPLLSQYLAASFPRIPHTRRFDIYPTDVYIFRV